MDILGVSLIWLHETIKLEFEKNISNLSTQDIRCADAVWRQSQSAYHTVMGLMLLINFSI